MVLLMWSYLLTSRCTTVVEMGPSHGGGGGGTGGRVRPRGLYTARCLAVYIRRLHHTTAVIALPRVTFRPVRRADRLSTAQRMFPGLGHRPTAPPCLLPIQPPPPKRRFPVERTQRINDSIAPHIYT